jgi:hypothetical protein
LKDVEKKMSEAEGERGMNRYGWNDLCDGESGRCRADLILEESGDWVLYSDHHAENVSLRADLAGLPENLTKRLDAAVAVVDDQTAQKNWPYVEKLLREILRWHEQQKGGVE